MKEITVISGKGGTGKTSVTAAFAALAQNAVLADCDVDAADLHLLLQPRASQSRDFYSGHVAVVDRDRCGGCGQCLALCRFGAIVETRPSPRDFLYTVDPASCEGCGVCVHFCPRSAIDFPERLCGEWMSSQTRFGPMVHARLGIAAENSGKLVSKVRDEARALAGREGRGMVLIDGPPGIGCPVIAAIGRASLLLVVTEPSVSGAHDLQRVLALAAHFKIPAAICVNKWDIAPDIADEVERMARQAGAEPLGRIRYDRAVLQAQAQGRTVIEADAPCAADIRNLWEKLNQIV